MEDQKDPLEMQRKPIDFHETVYKVSINIVLGLTFQATFKKQHNYLPSFGVVSQKNVPNDP